MPNESRAENTFDEQSVAPHRPSVQGAARSLKIECDALKDLPHVSVLSQNSNPSVLMMQPIKNRNRDDAADSLRAAEVGRIFA
jgi:hypothetical protein